MGQAMIELFLFGLGFLLTSIVMFAMKGRKRAKTTAVFDAMRGNLVTCAYCNGAGMLFEPRTGGIDMCGRCRGKGVIERTDEWTYASWPTPKGKRKTA